MPRPPLALITTSIILSFSSPALAHDHDVSRDRSPRLHLTGDVGFTSAFAENVAIAAGSVQVRIYAAEGIGALVRVGYEGLLFLNFGVVDLGVAYRHELPGGHWAGFGISAAAGFSAMIRDSVYHFTGDDVGFALFGTVGVDVRLGNLLLGLDAIGRWQLGAVPLNGPQTRGGDWAEAGAVIRIGGEVLL